MLAYVFWHRPASGVDAHAYERGMDVFHGALARPGSVTFALARTPWNGGPPAYEDWYPVRDWTDLGRLNDEAVSGARRAPHDAVARSAGWGAGGVWRRIKGELALERVGFAAWLDKPHDVPYDAFVASLPAPATVWQRQLVLGPAPEFVVLASNATAVPSGAVLTHPRLAASATA